MINENNGTNNIQDTINSILCEMYLVRAAHSANPQRQFEPVPGKNRYSIDLREKTMGTTFEVKCDTQIGTTKNVIFEIYEDQAQDKLGWTLRHLNKIINKEHIADYLVFVQKEASMAYFFKTEEFLRTVWRIVPLKSVETTDGKKAVLKPDYEKIMESTSHVKLQKGVLNGNPEVLLVLADLEEYFKKTPNSSLKKVSDLKFTYEEFLKEIEKEISNFTKLEEYLEYAVRYITKVNYGFFDKKGLHTIISGGQTGADRAGLEAGKILGLKTGGTAPKGYKTENGPDISLADFGVTESSSDKYPPRTRKNMLESDGTIIFKKVDSPGCFLTIKLAKELDKPFIINPSIKQIREWIKENDIRVLNVAGNRESVAPGITDKAKDYLVQAFGTESTVKAVKNVKKDVEVVGNIQNTAKTVKNVKNSDYWDKMIKRKDLKDNPNTIFIFGDNLIKKGMGGQAKEMRGEPNAYGIPTKKEPNNKDGSFFTDDEYEENIRAINESIEAIPSGRPIVIPTAGIGTGLANLEEKAPRTWSYLSDRLDFMVHKETKCKRTQDDFVHLHVHSQYSLLDGVADPEDIVKKVYDLGQPAVALTDHGVMYGSYKFQQNCQDWGVKAIQGVEAYYVDDNQDNSTRAMYHLILLAMNDEGWSNLCKIVTFAGRDGFYHKPRVDRKLLEQYNAGIICTSACYKSPVSFHLSEEGYDPDRARHNMKLLKKIFSDRFYNEVMCIDFPDYDNIVPNIIDLANEEGVKSVVTNDTHYASEGDDEVQSLLLKISTGGRMEEFEAKAFYLKSRAEMIRKFITPEMADMTLEIADRVKFKLSFEGYKFPKYNISKAPDYQKFIQSMEKIQNG